MSNDGVTVEAAQSVTPELLGALERLVPQLSSSSPPPGEPEVAETLSAPGTDLLVARGPDGDIIGTLTLVVFRIPTGVRAWIEDVVVDSGCRGQGIGEALVAEALRRASGAGARTVDLTSRPSRGAANGLYLKMGFERRDTNVYRRAL
jgi:ribosomal protein S18 acetylase RimI-like enzyme